MFLDHVVIQYLLLFYIGLLLHVLSIIMIHASDQIFERLYVVVYCFL